MLTAKGSMSDYGKYLNNVVLKLLRNYCHALLIFYDKFIKLNSNVWFANDEKCAQSSVLPGID